MSNTSFKVKIVRREGGVDETMRAFPLQLDKVTTFAALFHATLGRMHLSADQYECVRIEQYAAEFKACHLRSVETRFMA